MTAVVQREQSTTMASMGGFGNNIIVSHRIHRGSQTGPGAAAGSASSSSSSGPLLLTQGPAPSQQLTPLWGSQVLTGSAPSLSLDMDDVFDGGRTDAPSSSSLLLSSPSSSSSSSSSTHSPLPGGSGGGGPNSYRGDPYSR